MAGCQTKRERIAIRGAGSLLIRSLFDLQQCDDPRGEAEAAGFSHASWPLFGLLWPSGLQLAAQMAAWLAELAARRQRHPMPSGIPDLPGD